MTFSDLITLLRHYWRLVVALPVALSLAALCYTAMQPVQYSATAKLVLNDPTGQIGAASLMAAVSPLAQEAVSESSNEDVRLDVIMPKVDASMPDAQTISFIATSDSSNACVSTANEAVHAVASRAQALFEELDGQVSEELEYILRAVDSQTAEVLLPYLLSVRDESYAHCSAYVFDATSAIKDGSNGAKYVIAAFCGGLFAAICFILLRDAVRMPLRSTTDITNRGLRVLSYYPDEAFGERTLVGLKLGSSATIDSVVFTSLDAGDAKAPAGAFKQTVLEKGVEQQSDCLSINEALEASSSTIDVIVCDPVSSSVETLQASSRSDCVVICVRLWSDTAAALQESVTEMETVGAHIGGIVIVTN